MTAPHARFPSSLRFGDAGDESMPTFHCPICEKITTVDRNEDAPYRPFCCERCKMIDLGRWLDGTYRVSEPADPEDYDELPEEHTSEK
jgi:endogenous inhibitor of DNA gyrase (YacG/DUF329 family)